MKESIISESMLLLLIHSILIDSSHLLYFLKWSKLRFINAVSLLTVTKTATDDQENLKRPTETLNFQNHYSPFCVVELGPQLATQTAGKHSASVKAPILLGCLHLKIFQNWRVFPFLALSDRHPHDKAGKDKLGKWMASTHLLLLLRKLQHLLVLMQLPLHLHQLKAHLKALPCTFLEPFKTQAVQSQLTVPTK